MSSDILLPSSPSPRSTFNGSGSQSKGLRNGPALLAMAPLQCHDVLPRHCPPQPAYTNSKSQAKHSQRSPIPSSETMPSSAERTTASPVSTEYRRPSKTAGTLDGSGFVGTNANADGSLPRLPCSTVPVQQLLPTQRASRCICRGYRRRPMTNKHSFGGGSVVPQLSLVQRGADLSWHCTSQAIR